MQTYDGGLRVIQSSVYELGKVLPELYRYISEAGAISPKKDGVYMNGVMTQTAWIAQNAHPVAELLNLKYYRL